MAFSKITLFILLTIRGNNAEEKRSDINEVSTNFREFSFFLAKHSNLDDSSKIRGAAMSFPFGVGYMLANINNQVWNVSNDGIDNVLKIPKDKIASHYGTLAETLNKSKMPTHSLVFVRDTNSTVELTEGSKNFGTEIVYTDFITNSMTSWFTINNMVANNTGGKLHDRFLPRSEWFAGHFQPYSVSAYVNTNYIKLNFETSLHPIGLKPFSDDSPVNFYEAKGTFPILDRKSYIAVAIPFSEGTGYLVLALPKGKIQNFFHTDLADVLENADPTYWPEKNKTIEVPALNLTVYNKYYDNLKMLGINRTLCWYHYEDETQGNLFFAGPIVQTSYLLISSKLIEVTSATGSSINSVKEMKEIYKSSNEQSPIDEPNPNPTSASYSTQESVLGGSDESEDKIPSVIAYHPTTSIPSQSTVFPESIDQYTLQFNKPFFFYVYEKELGPLYYGFVNSLETYKKEMSNIEIDENFSWLLDLYKSSLWNCPA